MLEGIAVEGVILDMVVELVVVGMAVEGEDERLGLLELA